MCNNLTSDSQSAPGPSCQMPSCSSAGNFPFLCSVILTLCIFAALFTSTNAELASSVDSPLNIFGWYGKVEKFVRTEVEVLKSDLKSAIKFGKEIESKVIASEKIVEHKIMEIEQSVERKIIEFENKTSKFINNTINSLHEKITEVENALHMFWQLFGFGRKLF